MKYQELKQKSLVLEEGATIRDAMFAITDNQRGCVAIVDSEHHFLGVASDGDIRRAMVRGATEITPIIKCMNESAFFLRVKEKEKAEKIFETRQEINLIPIVDEKNVLYTVVIRNPEMRKNVGAA